MFVNDYKESNLRIIIAAFFIVIPIILSNFTFNIYKKDKAIKNYEKMIKEYPFDSYKGKSFITSSYPILLDTVLVGDSYAHFVAYDLGFDMTNFSCPGLTLEYLRQVFDGALKTNKKYVTIFIGPNDFAAKTPLSRFKELLKGYIDEIHTKMKAKVILCTYLPSDFTNMREKQGECIASIDEYNKIILDLIDEQNFIYYLDLSKYANVRTYYKSAEGYNDNIHFNKKFNIIFINDLYKKIMSIEKNLAYNYVD